MAMRLQVRVHPKSKRRTVEEAEQGQWIVRVTEPAEDGRANAAVVKQLAEHFGVPQRAVTILRGQTGHRKVIEIAGEPTRRPASSGAAHPAVQPPPASRPSNAKRATAHRQARKSATADSAAAHRALSSAAAAHPAAFPAAAAPSRQPGRLPIAGIVSGGQSGVDRAALDVALEFAIPCGGWCPQGRIAEDGTLASHYPLRETPSEGYVDRTTWNVRDSDGTLVLNVGAIDGGTLQTVEDARRLGKPHLIVDLDKPSLTAAAADWITAHRIRILNVAGPRETKRPGIYKRAVAWLRRLLASHPRTRA